MPEKIISVRSLLLGLCLCCCMLKAYPQNILHHEATLARVESCLEAIYGFDFDPARSSIEKLKKELPNHPAPYFLEGLWYYWRYFPILPGDRQIEPFLEAMERAIDLSTQRLKVDDTDLEGIFFDMHARAFRGMFWADNGRPGRVIRDLDNMYRQTMKGITFKEEFVEFYFSSGLYNYYIEAYVELRPVYKPIAALFRKGDKELGIKELHYATEHTTYIRYESLLFMSLLQLNYEKDLEAAATYARELHQLFPDNIYYSGQLLIILLHNDRFPEARGVLENLENQPGAFAKLLVDMGRGFMLERSGGYHLPGQINEVSKAGQNEPTAAKRAEARTYYERSLHLAEPFGAITDLYKAVCLAGLARISYAEGNEKGMRRNRRKSSSASSYEFIIDYDGLKEK